MPIEKKLHKVFFKVLFVISLLLFGQINASSTSFDNSKGSASNTDCEAAFSYGNYDGPLPVLGGITFENLSTGPYTDLTWDFGDGSYYSLVENKVTHFYSQSGSYEVSLTVYNSNTQECFSTSTSIVEVWISDDPCEQLDCVWPGDTNADGMANVEDILNIGLEYGTSGPPRDTVCGGWFGHPATDWEVFTTNGVDLKHGDCNGDGTIDLSDLPFTSNVSESYTPLVNGVSVAQSDAPAILLQFTTDTIHLTNSIDATKITAGIILGSSNVPIQDIYGVVLYLNYPGQYVDSSTQISVDYDENSFFGGTGEVIHRTVDLSGQGQMDFAITRKNGTDTSGFGRIAEVSFIIDADIIDGREEHEGQSFPVTIKVVKVIDQLGNDLEISLPAEPASVFFVNNIITKVVDPELSEKVKVYPNPVADVLNIDLGELNGQILELFNVLGKRIIHRQLDFGNTIDLNVSTLEKGIYLLKIQTDQGLVSKRVVVE